MPLEKARLARLEALQAQCDAILQRCYQRQREAIEAAAQGLAVEQYDHALYDIEQYTGFQSSYAQLSTRAIRQMLAMPVQGSDLSTALWRQDMDAGFQIRRMLGLMFTTGKPPQDFAKELQRIIGRRDAEGNLTGKTYEAYRLLYNEAAHVSEQAKLAAYGEDGIEELEIVTTLDSKTCGGCGPRDGKRVKVKDAVEGVSIPPFHVNCRCTTAPYVAAAQGSFTRTRAARDPVTGKTVRVKAQTFEEWKKGKENPAARAAIRNTGKAVKFSEKANYSIEIPRYSKQVNNGISNACKEVAQLGSATGKEHLVLVNAKTGLWQYRETGAESEVGGSDFWEFIKKHPDDKFVFIHNHNTDGWLSEADLMTLLTTDSIDAMIAVRNDGVIYTAPKNDGVNLKGFLWQLYDSEIQELRKKALLDDRLLFTVERESLMVKNALRDFVRGYFEHDGRN